MGARCGRTFAVAAPLVFASLLGLAHTLEPSVPPLRTAGIVGSATSADSFTALPPTTRGDYVPGTSLLATVGPPDPAAVAESRAWLAEAPVPGRAGWERALAERALLDLRLLSRDGAAVASARPSWRYVWPRDASWYAAAFAVTGHPAEAYDVLRFIARVQSADGTWDARYHPSGPPVRDGRPRQLDANGWVPWAVWLAVTSDAEHGQERLEELWPTVVRAADAAARALDPRGLPRPSQDYWETGPSRTTLGVAAPLLAGLRAAADLAERRGSAAEAARWHDASTRLAGGIARHFAPYDYARGPDGAGGRDAAVAWLAPPFGPADAGTTAAVNRARAVLGTKAGGHVPGERFPAHRQVGWTPTTASFALAAAAAGDDATATRLLRWLAGHTTAVGALPERVDQDGNPVAVAPLGWTGAAVLLALVARDHGLPAPPAP